MSPRQDGSMRSVCVLCGSNPGRRPEYLAGAADLGRVLAARGIRVVYGGAHVGLMGRWRTRCWPRAARSSG